MRRARTIIILVAMAITMLFVWQANAPAFAKTPVPTCRGINLLETLQTSDPKGYADLLAREKAIVNGQGLLWKIERPGTAASYLYGTMHMSDDRLTTLPGPVADALDEAGTVALELEEIADDAKMAQAVVKNFGLLAFTDGRTLDSILAGNNLELLKSTLKKYGMPYVSTRIMKPWFVMLSLSMPLCEIERQKVGFKALDKTIADTAKRNGSKIVGLESVKEQFTVFEALSERVQKEFLLSTLRQHHQLEDQIETMKQLYLQRRTAALWEFALYITGKDVTKNDGNGDKSFDELAVLKKFESQLVLKRNKIMHDRSLPLLEKGKTFIAVGAAHLPGKDGIVSLLRKSGYKMSVVY